MNTAELTAIHTQTLNEIRFERTMANITRRAETLFSDGYSATPQGNGLYSVFTPAKDVYAVRVSDTPADPLFGHYCSCPAHEKYGTCKHLQALLMAIEEGAEGDARQEAILNKDDDRYPEL